MRALVEDLKTALIDKDAKMARLEEERSKWSRPAVVFMS